VPVEDRRKWKRITGMKHSEDRTDTAGRTALPPEVLSQIVKAIGQIRYGSVEVSIHDSRVVQIESREKWRFQSDKPRA